MISDLRGARYDSEPSAPPGATLFPRSLFRTGYEPVFDLIRHEEGYRCSARRSRGSSSGIEVLLKERNVDYVSFKDWKLLDEYETETGQAQDRPRAKVTSVEKMLEIIRDKKK